MDLLDISVIDILRRGKNWTRICGVRPTYLNALNRGSGAATLRTSEVAGLRGGGKVAAAGGRSGIVLSRGSGLPRKTGCHAGLRLRSAKGNVLYSRW